MSQCTECFGEGRKARQLIGNDIYIWLFPPPDNRLAWRVVEASMFVIAGCAGALAALLSEIV